MGQFIFLEKNWKRKRLSKLWYILQDSDYQLFSDSVYNELLMGTKITADKKAKAENLLKSLDLWELKDQHPFSLSGGQKQSLTFAVGYMSDADILILDEPTSGLDSKNLLRVADLINQLSKDGIAVIVITRDYELIQTVCHRVLF
ncbi:hypothetical protein AZF37_00685 [endosymbiont 'TC1' of Trimyema compressum]|nr:hypothetical protein AZF37_00685 [endosymbiont 'TC1' of Trimyema compressum]